MSVMKGIRKEAGDIAVRLESLMDSQGVTEFVLTAPGVLSSIIRTADGLQCRMKTGLLVSPSTNFQAALELMRLSDVLEAELLERAVATQAQMN